MNEVFGPYPPTAARECITLYGKSAGIHDRLYAGSSGRGDGRAIADHIRREIRSANPDATTLLDVACGTGRYLPYLQETFSVVGIDLNADLLAAARQKTPEAEFHEADMTNFELGRRFDVITCMWGSIGYVKTLDRFRGTLACFANHLAPGGVIIIEPWYTPDTYWKGHVAAEFLDEPDLKVAWMYRQDRQGALSVRTVHYLVATNEGVDYFTEQHDLALFTHEEYSEAMTEIGLTVTYESDWLGPGLYVGVARP